MRAQLPEPDPLLVAMLYTELEKVRFRYSTAGAKSRATAMLRALAAVTAITLLDTHDHSAAFEFFFAELVAMRGSTEVVDARIKGQQQ